MAGSMARGARVGERWAAVGENRQLGVSQASRYNCRTSVAPGVQQTLIAGAYELFRSFYGPPPKTAPDSRGAGATVGLLRSQLELPAQAVAALSIVVWPMVEDDLTWRGAPGLSTALC